MLTGEKASSAELIAAATIGFLIGYKVLFIIFNFSTFIENTQSFIFSLQGNFLGGFISSVLFTYLKFREKQKTKLNTPIWVTEQIHPYQLVATMTLMAAYSGIIGAKLFHIFENWDAFISDPINAFLSLNGLTMYGGLILASAILIYYGHKNKITVTHLIDSAAPSIMLAYAIGRMGCHVSGDGDWGISNVSPKPDWLSWAPNWVWAYDYSNNIISAGESMTSCLDTKYCNHLVPAVWPTSLYEAIICVGLFFVLWNFRKRITTPGILFSIYLIVNGFERFFIEKIRINTLQHIGKFTFTQAELISALLIMLGIIGLWYFKKIAVTKINS